MKELNIIILIEIFEINRFLIKIQMLQGSSKINKINYQIGQINTSISVKLSKIIIKVFQVLILLKVSNNLLKFLQKKL
jgi:hypothetical protein